MAFGTVGREDGAQKMQSITNQLEVICKYLMISLLPFEGVESSICGECSSFITKANDFRNRCQKADEMFKELISRKNITQHDLESIRFKYGVDNEDVKHCPALTDTENHSVEQDQSPDPLEVQIEAPVIIKQEKSEEVLPAPRKHTDIEKTNSTRKKKKLFVVSYCEEKSYLSVPYAGTDLEYDDFVQSACSYLDLPEISIYDPKEIRISSHAFTHVFEENAPEYVIVKSGGSSRSSLPSISRKASSEYATYREDSSEIFLEIFKESNSNDDIDIESENIIAFEEPHENNINDTGPPQRKRRKKVQLNISYEDVLPMLRDYFIKIGGSGLFGKTEPLSRQNRKYVIQNVCKHLYQHCDNPKGPQKIAWANATITLFPSLRSNNPKAPYDDVFNPIDHGGFLGNRIKNSIWRRK
uniref:Uncharacterized protein n=1 Tax=Phlebotomus papatasi TaxID=29031 RepID=A0A1B0CYI4_PHLPP